MRGEIEVFPAGAGMNRLLFIDELNTASVPRWRGDEPNLRMGRTSIKWCSPLARG